MKLQIVLGIAILLVALPVCVQGAGELRIDPWLVLGPADIVVDGKALSPGGDAALDYDFLDPARLRPLEGAKIQWGARRTISWRSSSARFGAPAARQAVYLAAYLESQRWLQADLAIEAAFPVKVYLDGSALAKDGDRGFYPLALSNGKHLLVVKGILLPKGDASPKAPPQGEQGHALRAVIKRRPAFTRDPLKISLDASRRCSMEDVLNTVTIQDVFLSPDGRHAAVALRRLPRGASSGQQWLEIIDTQNGSRLFTSRGLGEMGGFCWLGDSRRFSFTRAEKDLTDLCLYDLGDHSNRTLLAGMKNFSSYWWADDGSYLVYATAEEPVGDRPYRHVQRIDDRSAQPERRQALTLFFPAAADGGTRLPLSGFADDFSQVRVSPDGRSLLLVSYPEDPKVRPFHRNVLVLYSLAEGRRQQILDDPWIEDFVWSPDSGKLLLLGGASAFSGMGSTLPPEVIPNDFDAQAYVYDLRTKKAEPLSRSFAPSIDSAFWHPNGSIYMKVTDQDHARLYRCRPGEKRFTRLETACDAVESVSFSRSGRAVFSGSGLAAPQKLFVLDLGAGGARVLKDYNRDDFAAVRFGRTENWSFKTREGRRIGGYLCFPPGFDPARLWPCIVNYYGGTTPIGRNFGGRYPKDWYAANGYVVCVLQPSGAIGYGQEFSSAHVNDWGEITSEEIIRGVEELLRTHPYIDNRRVGAIGASYGGFMTQLLAGKTDLFAALISHAGISALSSYWGVGDWGYSYSGVATAGSFPWNRKDIYVGHSPLFMAERVRKPLLLLHGEDDNNVPPGESYQMFAALRLLGKEVALVTFPGQRHFILSPEQRVRWLQTIMAWFDRWLKGEGEWWNELYPGEK
ncbi:MAG: S9 family peptidase [Candidatus Aminicenantes bacterium]|nr:S9 family peptidase [Candidatus Aminicenantes bacterium]